MNKFLLSTVGMILFTFNLGFAQEQTKLEIGLHAAPVASSWSGAPTFKRTFDIQYQFKLGFNAGVSVQYIFNSKFSFLSEINFERKGNVVLLPDVVDDNGDYIGDGKEDIHEDYLTIPLTVKYKFGQRKTKCFLDAGMYVGYLLAYGWHGYAVGSYPEFRYEDDPNNYQRIDYGLVAGFGLEIPMKEKLLFSIEARNNLGLHRLAKGLTYNNEFIKNESLELLIGLSYKIKPESLAPLNKGN